MTYGGIFSENYTIVFNVDLNGIVFCDAKSLADLFGDYYSSELVDVSDNTCGFHCYLRSDFSVPGRAKQKYYGNILSH